MNYPVNILTLLTGNNLIRSSLHPVRSDEEEIVMGEEPHAADERTTEDEESSVLP